jgi:hypothetical protein
VTRCNTPSEIHLSDIERVNARSIQRPPLRQWKLKKAMKRGCEVGCLLS